MFNLLYSEALTSTLLFIGGRASVSHIEAFALLTAWFVGMGLHEGAHAYAANKLGDPLPRMMGKLTFNPFKHIEWNNWNYVLGAVVLPIATTYSLGIPLGMAWVMVQQMGTKHDAKVALAGPIGSFAAALIGVILLVASWPAIQAQTFGPMGTEILFTVGWAMVVVSIIYGVFNLVPLPPLDGGTVAYHFLNNDGRRMFDAIRPYGFLILIAMVWLVPPLTNGLIDPSRQLLWPAIGFLSEIALAVPNLIWG